MTIETLSEPPNTDTHDDGDDDIQSGRLSLIWIDIDDSLSEASVQLLGAQAADPQRFATALIDTALALARLRGPDVYWAAAQALTAYGADCGPRPAGP